MISFSDNGKKRKKYKVKAERCFGCGICEAKCKKENISLILDPEKGLPLDIEVLLQSKEIKTRM
jgi:ferredoxin